MASRIPCTGHRPTVRSRAPDCGSLEYQHGFVKEAMEMFLTLTKLPENEEDLAEIIDKAGNFLLDHEDFKNALRSYLSAERTYPTQALHYIGSGYCFSKLGNIEEAIRKERRAVELEPNNYFHLNDLGTLSWRQVSSKRQKPCSSDRSV